MTHGIILAGGTGTRWLPCSLAVNKHLLPLFDQPVVYHPLAMLMRAGIRDISLVTGAGQEDDFRRLLGDGSAFGIRLTYVTQPRATGIADAIRHCRGNVGDRRFCVALGDNLFSQQIDGPLRRGLAAEGAVIFACRSQTPEEFGVVELDDSGAAVSLLEKPARPRSDLVVPGLYVYPPGTFELLESLRPSARGELEVSALNRAWLERGALQVEPLPEGADWLDLGTPERLAQATELVRRWEAVGGDKPGCPEAVAWRQGWIDDASLANQAHRLAGSVYGRYLSMIYDSVRGPA